MEPRARQRTPSALRTHVKEALDKKFAPSPLAWDGDNLLQSILLPMDDNSQGCYRQEETPQRPYKINGFRSSTSRAARRTFAGSTWAFPMCNTFPWAVSAMKRIFEFCFPPSPQNMWFQAGFVPRMHCYHVTRWLAIGISSEKENVTGTSRGNTCGRVWGRRVVGNDTNERRWSYWDQQLNPALGSRLQVQSPNAGCAAGRRCADRKSETSSWCYPAKSMPFLLSRFLPRPWASARRNLSLEKTQSLFRPSATPLAWWTYRKERAWDSLEDASGLLRAFKYQHKAPYMLEWLLQSTWKITRGAWTKPGNTQREGMEVMVLLLENLTAYQPPPHQLQNNSQPKVLRQLIDGNPFLAFILSACFHNSQNHKLITKQRLLWRCKVFPQKKKKSQAY